MPGHEPITLDMLVWAYSSGIFPMAEHRDGPAQWYAANPRAVLPLDDFTPSHSLRQRVRRGDYEIRRDTAFERVIRACAEPRKAARSTWINDQIIDVFCAAHRAGLAHSVEAWGFSPEQLGRARTKGDPPAQRVLLGGLYGMSLGGAFMGESMFSRATDASKVCLFHLVEHLRSRGYALLDVQMNSDHMKQFGTIEIPREEYERQLAIAVRMPVSWD
jgi:leucyl/phenylalanyl-tRNA--protein transferase